MSVQAAVTPANDFFQKAVSTKTDNPEQNAGSPRDGSNSDFKNVLMSFRGERPRNAEPKAAAQKNFAAGVVMAVEPANGDAENKSAVGIAWFEHAAADAQCAPLQDLGDILAPPAAENKPASEIALSEEPSNVAAAEESLTDISRGAHCASATENKPAPEIASPAAPEIALSEESSNAAAAEEALTETSRGAHSASAAENKPAPEIASPAAPKIALSEEPSNVAATKEALTETGRGAHGESAAENKPARDGGGQSNAGHGGTDDAPQAHDDQSRPVSAEGRREIRSVQPEAIEADAPDDSGKERPAAVNPFGSVADAGAENRVSNEGTPAVLRLPVTYTLASGEKFGEGLLTVVEFVTRGESSEVRIIVEPPALGRVDVSLKASASGVEVLFRVDNETLLQMVQNQLDSLKTSLQAQGIHVSGLTVDIRNGEYENHRGERSSKSKGKGRGTRGGDDGDAAEVTRIARLDLERGLLHWVA